MEYYDNIDCISPEKVAFNKKLVKKYPFLVIDGLNPEEGTWRDNIPMGWEHLFDLMCEKLLEEIEDTDMFETFRFEEVKEKFGELRIYSDGGNEETDRIIDEWSFLSGYICENCGNPVVRVTTGWISPVCFDCWSKYNSHEYNRYIQKTNPVHYPPVMKIIKYRSSYKEDLEIDLSEEYQRLLDDWNEEVER